MSATKAKKCINAHKNFQKTRVQCTAEWTQNEKDGLGAYNYPGKHAIQHIQGIRLKFAVNGRKAKRYY